MKVTVDRLPEFPAVDDLGAKLVVELPGHETSRGRRRPRVAGPPRQGPTPAPLKRPVPVDRLPTFPRMADLGPEHLRRLKELVEPFPPYSDFNVVSLWGWSAAGRFRVAEYADNLVVEFGDYLSEQRYLSFIGSHALTETATILLRAAASDSSLVPTLRLVPEIVASHLDADGQFAVTEICDDRDYLYDPGAYLDLAGPGMRRLRQGIKRHHGRDSAMHAHLFREEGDHSWIRAHEQQLTDLFDRWEKLGREGAAYAASERLAFEYLLSNLDMVRDLFEIRALCWRDEHELRFISIFELLRGNECMGHYAKSDGGLGRDFGRFAFVDEARWLYERGVGLLNSQQDLGLSGLRFAKRENRPSSYLRKYNVEPLRAGVRAAT